MWFKNARLYNVDLTELKSVFDDEQQLNDALSSTSFTPCTAQEVATSGFIPLFGPDTPYCYRQGQHYFCQLQEENKLLPASVVKNELENQIRIKEQELNRKVNHDERNAMKTAVQNQLLSRAFTTRRTYLIWINPESKLVAIGASSAKRAEGVLAMLRQALGSFPAKILQPRCVVEDRMTAWLSDPAELPEQFALGTDTVLKSPAEEGGVIRASREDLTSEEIAVHINSGKVSTEVQVIFREAVSLVLTSDLSLKRLKLLDLYLERMLPEQTDDEIANLQGQLIIQADLLNELGLAIMEIFDCDHQ
ncbi:MAG: recombination-associated protein RdgC [Succinivibrio sp.]|nr:recombination-associated protein RdgC [Succinivibrio sp.]